MAAASRSLRDPSVSLTRVLDRLTTPALYLAALGGIQVGLLWVLRSHFGILLPAVSTAAYLGLLAGLLLVRGHWTAKLWATAGLSLLTSIGPTVVEVIHRAQGGISMEHDGLIQVEAAIDKVLQGQPIYGVDWSNTPLGAVPWFTTTGPNPALHHQAYFPLIILVGVPVRALTNLLGWPFDYRIVLIGFALLGLAAILSLPITAQRRVLLLTAVLPTAAFAGHIARLDRADMLVADHAASIDDEAFGHPRRAERDLDIALPVASDPLVRVTIAGEENSDVLRAVTDGNAVDADSSRLELLQHGSLLDARDAPAGEHVDQPRSPAREVARRQPKLAGQHRRKRKGRKRLARELRRYVAAGGCRQSPHQPGDQHQQQRQRREAHGAAHA